MPLLSIIFLSLSLMAANAVMSEGLNFAYNEIENEIVVEGAVMTVMTRVSTPSIAGIPNSEEEPNQILRRDYVIELSVATSRGLSGPERHSVIMVNVQDYIFSPAAGVRKLETLEPGTLVRFHIHRDVNNISWTIVKPDGIEILGGS